MKIIKIFLPFILLSLFSLCPFLPKQLPAEITPSETVIINSPTGELNTPTAILNMPTPTIAEILPTPTQTITEIMPTPTQESLIPGDLEKITVDNIQSLAIIGEIPYPQIQPDHLIYSLNFSNDGTKLIIKSQNWKNRKSTLIVWDLISNAQVLEIKDLSNIGRAYFSPDEDQFWVFREGFLDQYALQDGVLVDSIAIPDYTGIAFAISPNGEYIATGTYDGITQNSTVHFYEFESLNPYFSRAMAYMIMSFRFSPDSRMVAATSAQIGGSITKIWDVETGSMLKDFYNYSGGPLFSSDSKLVVFAKGNDFSVLSTETWVVKKSFQNYNPSSTNIPKFLLAGDQILAIQETVSVIFNDVNTGEELLELPEQVTVVNYSPILNVIITNTNLESIKLWGILP